VRLLNISKNGVEMALERVPAMPQSNAARNCLW
jgi:hypothetical protein